MDIFSALSFYAGNIFYYGLIFLFTISLVVFIHEMGHFLTARLFGVRVHKFSIGFGKELFGFTSKSGTHWCLSRIPLGGYVEIFGYGSASQVLIWDPDENTRRPLQEDEKPYAFCEKPLWQRALIVVMGPLINFIFAFLIFFIMFIAIGEPSTKPQITAVNMDSSGYEAGIRPMDNIIKVDGTKIKRLEEFWEKSREPNAEIDLLVERDGKLFETRIVSRPVAYRDLKGIERAHGQSGLTNFNGVRLEHILSINGETRPEDDAALRQMLLDILDQPAQIRIKMAQSGSTEFLIYPRSDVNKGLMDPLNPDYNVFYFLQSYESFYMRHGGMDAFWYSGKRIVHYVGESLQFLQVIFQGRGGVERIGGLVTMGTATRKAVERGIITYFMFLAILSIQVGFINLFPVPVLDGGYLLFFGYEALSGQALSERFQDYALTIGMILLFGLMIFANINDILRLPY